MQVEPEKPDEIISNYRKRIDAEIMNYFNIKYSEVKDDLSKTAIELIREFTINGGKRLRPIFMILGHNLFANEDESIFRASISIELAQSYLLIHDDIIDQSDIRRGKPSMHVAIQRKLLGNGRESRRLAEGLAIVAGDLAEAYAHESLLSSGFRSSDVVRADLELSRTIETTGYGQFLDIMSADLDNFCMNDLMRLHLWKTAKYTLEGPLSMGAILSGTREDIFPLKSYGKLLGIAFQLKDDILGLFGDEKTIGKSIFSDVNEGKKTLLMLKAIEFSGQSDKKFIIESLKTGNITRDDFEKLKKIVIDTGSYDYSVRLMEKLVEGARKYLLQVRGNDNAKKVLNWLSEYLINRDH
ncbi:MAG: polyprenyl synthetase family protein [Thermoplasmata archaeon]